MLYVEIHGEKFPYENGLKLFNNIRGQQFYLNLCIELPVKKQELMQKHQITSINEMAASRLDEVEPAWLDLTSYGTRRKGYYAALKAQLHKTMWWVFNNCPSWVVLFVDTIDVTVQGYIKMLIQNGVNVKVSIPATGYDCAIEAVYNKKENALFTGKFLCEAYLNDWDNAPENVKQLGKDWLSNKVKRLLDYRATVQKQIWELVEYTLKPYADEWRTQNLYTLNTRREYADRAYTAEILSKYAEDMHIPANDRVTLSDILQPQMWENVLRTVRMYGPAFGIYVKTESMDSDCQTFMPKEWLKYNPLIGPVSDSTLLKQCMKKLNSLSRDALHEIITAYIQIDWYLTHTPEEYLESGFKLCPKCNAPIRTTDDVEITCDLCGTELEDIDYELPLHITNYLEYDMFDNDGLDINE